MPCYQLPGVLMIDKPVSGANRPSWSGAIFKQFHCSQQWAIIDKHDQCLYILFISWTRKRAGHSIVVKIEEAVIEEVISKHTSLRYNSIYLVIDS